MDASNPDLAPVMWDEGLTSGIERTGGEDEYGFSTVTDGGASSTGQVTNFHGAHVAGIIGAAWDGKGVSGMASNVRIMSVRHNDTLDTLLQCLDYVSRARDAGVDVRVTNNSWGGTRVRTFLWTGYAASPRLLRYCIGLIQPSLSFGRPSL